MTMILVCCAVTAVAFCSLGFVIGCCWEYGRQPIDEQNEDLRATVTRQAYELLDVRRERAFYQRACLLAEHRLPVQAVAEILDQERRVVS